MKSLMYTTTRSLLGVLLFSGISFSLAGTGSVELPANIVSQFDLNLQQVPSQYQLKSIESEITSDGSIITSRLVLSSSSSGIVRIDQRVKGGAINVARRALTVLGMIDLASAELFSSDADSVDVPIMAGEVMVPVSLPVFNDTNVTRNTSSLEGDVTSIVSPNPNGRFSFVHDYKTKIETSGMFGMKKNMITTATVLCETSTKKSAAEIHPDLRGSYVRVICNETHPTGEQHKR